MSPFHGNIVTLNNHLWILESSVLIFRLLTPSWDDVHLRFMNISQLFKTSPYSIIFLSVCSDINMFFSDETFFNVSWKPIYLRFLKCFTCVQFHKNICSTWSPWDKYTNTQIEYTLGGGKWLLFFYTLLHCGWDIDKSGLPPLWSILGWTILSTFAIRIQDSGLPTPIITLVLHITDNADIWVIVLNNKLSDVGSLDIIWIFVWMTFNECSADIIISLYFLECLLERMSWKLLLLSSIFYRPRTDRNYEEVAQLR